MKTTAIKKAMTKSQIIAEIAESNELTKKDVAAVLDDLSLLIERHVKKASTGSFTLPGVLKVRRVKTPARKARKNVPNPFKPGETMDIPAKPASSKLKIVPLKALKDKTK